MYTSLYINKRVSIGKDKASIEQTYREGEPYADLRMATTLSGWGRNGGGLTSSVDCVPGTLK